MPILYSRILMLVVIAKLKSWVPLCIGRTSAVDDAAARV